MFITFSQRSLRISPLKIFYTPPPFVFETLTGGVLVLGFLLLDSQVIDSEEILSLTGVRHDLTGD